MIRDDLRLGATVLSHFDAGWLGADEDEQDALGDLLLEDCVPIEDEAGRRHWAVQEWVRRAVVARSGTAVLREVWASLPRRPEDAGQWAIDQLLTAGGVPPRRSRPSS